PETAAFKEIEVLLFGDRAVGDPLQDFNDSGGEDTCLDLKEVSLRQIFQAVTPGMFDELIEIDRRIVFGEVVMKQRTIRKLVHPLQLFLQDHAINVRLGAGVY